VGLPAPATLCTIFPVAPFVLYWTVVLRMNYPNVVTSAFTFRAPVLLAAAVLAFAILFAPVGYATVMTFSISASGAKEVNAAGVPNQGDPDGTATGTLTLNNGTGSGTTGSATFSLTLNNIDLTTLTGHHIHQAPATTTGTIVLDFGDPDTIRSGSVLSGTISNLSATTITSVFANPAGFYYNIHNGAFPGGAVRDQLTPIPEPAAVSLLPLAALAIAARRRRS
jgi:hypothetical protein